MTEEINKKARELVNKFYQPLGHLKCGVNNTIMWEHAKQCALIDTQNTIDALSEYDKRTEEYLKKQFPNYFSAELQNMDSDFRYWNKIKQAIENP